jgi:hypothetical protein
VKTRRSFISDGIRAERASAADLRHQFKISGFGSCPVRRRAAQSDGGPAWRPSAALKLNPVVNCGEGSPATDSQK